MAKAKAKKSAKEVGRKIGETIGAEIDKEREKGGCCDNRKTVYKGGGNAVYGLGFIGAAIYFIQYADGFWMGVLGVLKAIVWPAILIYKWLVMAGM